MWNCPTCTFINPANDPCDMCSVLASQAAANVLCGCTLPKHSSHAVGPAGYRGSPCESRRDTERVAASLRRFKR